MDEPEQRQTQRRNRRWIRLNPEYSQSRETSWGGGSRSLKGQELSAEPAPQMAGQGKPGELQLPAVGRGAGQASGRAAAVLEVGTATGQQAGWGGGGTGAGLLGGCRKVYVEV